jgi:hypothetical protein
LRRLRAQPRDYIGAQECADFTAAASLLRDDMFAGMLVCRDVQGIDASAGSSPVICVRQETLDGT